MEGGRMVSVPTWEANENAQKKSYRQTGIAVEVVK